VDPPGREDGEGEMRAILTGVCGVTAPLLARSVLVLGRTCFVWFAKRVTASSGMPARVEHDFHVQSCDLNRQEI
jgi:hypothetical protein